MSEQVAAALCILKALSPPHLTRAGAPQIHVRVPSGSWYTAWHGVELNETEGTARSGLGGTHKATLTYSEDSVQPKVHPFFP